MERSHSYSNFAATAQAAQQQREQLMQPPLATCSNSSDNLPHACNQHQHLPPNKPLRKRRKLQRQQSIVLDDGHDLTMAMDFDCPYAADLEENADGDLGEVGEVPRLRNKHHHPHHHQAMQRHISCSSNNSTGSRCLRHEDSFDSCSTAPELSPQAVRQHRFSSLLLRDSSVSIQSDSSRYSSVDSLLEARKPDPEAILINLGFGPVGTDDMLSRIPKRFLKPSQVPGIDTEAFVKRLQVASSLADSSALGYRGLTSSSDQPPSTIVAKIMQRFEVNNQRKKSMGNIGHAIR